MSIIRLISFANNACDFATTHYKGSKDIQIVTKIHRDDNLFRISVRNSNPKDIKIFGDKTSIFNYEGRSGTKQGVYVISRGLLGDALKQILSLGYVLNNINEDVTRLTNKQWEYPLTIHHNGEEWKIKLFVDKVQQIGIGTPECISRDLDHTDTEIELVLPMVREARLLSRSQIEIFCKEYATFTTDISLRFRIVDDSTPLPTIERQKVEEDEDDQNEDDTEDREPTSKEIEESLAANIISALTTPAEKAIVNLEFSALHPLSVENLNNANSVHTCSLIEFADRITNMQHKEDITIHEFLKTYREGTQLPKTEDNQRTISQLVNDPDRDVQIEKYYKELKTAIREPAKAIVLPYKKEERKKALIKRISELYDIDKNQEPSYKLVPGFYNDSGLKKIWSDNDHYRIEEGKGIIKFPYVFEILAIPRAKPLEGEVRGKPKQTIFIGAVNYSTSPKSNIFEGEYNVLASGARNIISVLERCGFHTYYGPTSKLPCIIVGNLITLRREPHGYDKSRIDIQPFADTIISACIKIASGIKTYRGAGYHFYSKTNYSTGKQRSSDAATLEDLVTKLLQTRGLRK